MIRREVRVNELPMPKIAKPKRQTGGEDQKSHPSVTRSYDEQQGNSHEKADLKWNREGNCGNRLPD
jgi:hypothetical protein